MITKATPYLWPHAIYDPESDLTVDVHFISVGSSDSDIASHPQLNP